MGKLLEKLDAFLRGAGDKLKETAPAQSESESIPEVKGSIPVEDQTPVAKETVAPTTEQKPEKKAQLESKDDLLRSVVVTLKNLIDDKELSKGMTLVIWLDTEDLKFRNYANELYCQRLLTALVNEHGYYFEEVSFSLGRPSEEIHASRIGENELEYIQVVDKIETPEPVSCRASISIFGEAGSLLQERYILSSDEMKEKMISAYNIGAGRFPKVPTGYRENHIAIDDNPQSPFVEKNKYVSRMHAHIGFSDTIGFYLQVENDGTRLMGKRTRIFRGEEKIECDNPEAKIQLENGDLIELGKAVVLRYLLLNDK